MKYSVKYLRNALLFALVLAFLWHGKLKRKQMAEEPHKSEQFVD
jgi:hypothetical protein